MSPDGKHVVSVIDDSERRAVGYATWRLAVDPAGAPLDDLGLVASGSDSHGIRFIGSGDQHSLPAQ
jgi:hypothetical protein